MTTRPLDQQRQEAFAGRMLEVLNGGSLVFLTSVGHKRPLRRDVAAPPLDERGDRAGGPAR